MENRAGAKEANPADDVCEHHGVIPVLHHFYSHDAENAGADSDDHVCAQACGRIRFGAFNANQSAKCSGQSDFLDHFPGDIGERHEREEIPLL